MLRHYKRTFLLNIAELSDRPPETSVRSRQPGISPFRCPETAAMSQRPGCASRDGNSKSLRPRPEASADLLPAIRAARVSHPRFGTPRAPTARAHQQEPTFLRGPAALSRPRV